MTLHGTIRCVIFGYLSILSTKTTLSALVTVSTLSTVTTIIIRYEKQTVVSTMGELIRIEGREVPVEEEATVRDVKERLDRDEDELATYEENGEVKVLGDRDVITDAVPEGTNISFQPGEGNVFG